MSTIGDPQRASIGTRSSPGQSHLRHVKSLAQPGYMARARRYGPYHLCRYDQFLNQTQGNILFSNELARQYGPDGIVSISINVGTDLARHAGSFVGSIGRMCKYAWFYVMSCGEVNFLTDERNTLTETATRTATQARDNAADAATQARDHIEEAVTNIGSGEATEMDGIELPNTHGAITCLFAGTSPEAGDYNGKVCFVCPASSTPLARRLTFFSISPPGHDSRFHIPRLATPSPRRSCGIGVKIKSKTSARPTARCFPRLVHESCQCMTTSLLSLVPYILHDDSWFPPLTCIHTQTIYGPSFVHVTTHTFGSITYFL